MAGVLGGKGERDVQNSEQYTACGTIALECEAFLAGTLAEYWEDKGMDLPVWAYMNLLAHGDVSDACADGVDGARHIDADPAR